MSETRVERPAVRAIDAALRSPRSTLVHARTDRAGNVTLHRAVWDAVRAAV